MVRRVLMASTTTAAFALLGEQVHTLSDHNHFQKYIILDHSWEGRMNLTWYYIRLNIGLTERGLRSGGTRSIFSV